MTTAETISEAMESLTKALEARGMTATYTPDPIDESFGRIEFGGNTWKHRMSLNAAGVRPEIGNKVFFIEDYRPNLVTKAYEVIRQLSR